MYRKNTAGQFICVQLLLTASGAVATGLSPAARRCIDGTFAAGGGTFTEDGSTGSYKYALAQADTNGNDISIIVTATGAMPVCVNFVTTAGDPTDSVRFGLTALPNAAASAIGGLPLAVDTSGRVDVLKINGTSQTARDIGASVLLASGQKVDVDTIKTNPVVNAGTITFPTGAILASTTNITAGTIATVTNLTNAPTSGDLTATMKASVTTAATAATPTAAAVTGAVGSVTGAVGSISGVTFPTRFSSLAIDISGNVTFGNTSIATVANLTNLPAIPANWLTAAGIAAAALNGKGDWPVGKTGYSISGTITTLDALATHGDSTWLTATGFATPTNITAGTITTATNLTNAPTAGDFTAAMKTSLNAATPVSTLSGDFSATMKTSLNAATPAVTVSDKTGFSLAAGGLASITAWTVAITGNITGNLSGSAGSVTGLTASDVGSIKTTLGVAGAGLTALGDTRLAHLDADVSSRSTFAGGAVASVTGSVGSVVGLTASNLDATISSRLPTSGYTAPDNSDIAAIKAKTDHLPDSDIVNTSGKLWVLDGSGNAIAPATQTQAIQNKTDNLPSDPADESIVLAAIAALPTTTTVMPADIKKVNGVTVNGNGAGTPWGP